MKRFLITLILAVLAAIPVVGSTQLTTMKAGSAAARKLSEKPRARALAVFRSPVDGSVWVLILLPEDTEDGIHWM